MSTVLRIVLIILCIVALYYLVVTLARGVAERETGWLGVEGPALAALGDLADERGIGALG